MKQENKAVLIKYLIYTGIACLITVVVFAMQGFFTDDIGVNMQILADGFTVSGALLLMYAGIMFVSSKGALLGIGFIFRNSVLAWFIPNGRKKHELYKDYYERKTSELKKALDVSAWIVGGAFFAVGIVFTVIWYTNYYNIPV